MLADDMSAALGFGVRPPTYPDTSPEPLDGLLSLGQNVHDRRRAQWPLGCARCRCRATTPISKVPEGNILVDHQNAPFLMFRQLQILNEPE